MKKSENPVFIFVITLILGSLGIHRFITGRIGTGILYLFTGGLFGIGWFVDVVVSGYEMFRYVLQDGSHTENPERQSFSMVRCHRCGREIPFSSSRVCEHCREEMKRKYLETSEHFASVIDEIEGNLVHLEDYLKRFDILSRDIDKMWDMSRDIDVTPPFQRSDLQKAMNKKFTDAVNNRISMSMEKARITLDQSRLKEELTSLTEELIECKYHYSRYSELINKVIEKIKEVITTL